VAKVVAQSNNEQDIMASDIASNEVIQFFRTAAAYQSATNTWRIPIHGWVHEPQQSRFRKALFSWALNVKYNVRVSADAQQYYERRLNLLIADNERGKTPQIKIADQLIAVGPSAANGHFFTEIELSNDSVRSHRQGNVLKITATSTDQRQFHGEVLLVEDNGLSMISDIDDTIKESNVLNHQQLIDNTFLRPFVAVPGMSAAYQRLSIQVDALHFVSSSPWQLYGPLQEFIDQENFPLATFSLKAIRFRDMTLFDLFKPGIATKPLQILQVLEKFPGRRFILVGDSGEQDPEVYAEIARAYPTRIEKIFIRNITAEHLDNARFKPLVNDPHKWTLFTDPTEIKL